MWGATVRSWGVPFERTSHIDEFATGVFGVPLVQLPSEALCGCEEVVDDTLPDLPLVVFACVEELYRTGSSEHILEWLAADRVLYSLRHDSPWSFSRRTGPSSAPGADWTLWR